MKIIFSVLCIIMFSGCVGLVLTGTRRTVVHNDFIYVKKSRIAYRRYLPSGIRLRGNPELLKEVGKINSSNKYIIVFGSYYKLKNSGLDFRIHENSKKFIK